MLRRTDDMKRIMLAVTAFSLIFSVVAVADFYSFGRSITMNFSITMGNKSVESSGNYISAEDSGSVIALVSGSAFGTRFDTGSLQMRLPLSNNRFFLVFTSGSNRTIARKLDAIGELPQTRFGDLEYSRPAVFPVFLRLEYCSLDLVSKARWVSGAVELLIRNEDGISMEVVQ
jgi:hypothetical protein